MRQNILNLAYAKAFNLVPIGSPVIFLYDLLFHQRTTNQLHRQSFQINSPSSLESTVFESYILNIFIAASTFSFKASIEVVSLKSAWVLESSIATAEAL